MVAFGGAGPLHANALGKLTGAFPVIIPPSPGVLCAYGDATTVLRHEIGRPLIRRLDDITLEEIKEVLDNLHDQVQKVMVEQQGVPKETQVSL